MNICIDLLNQGVELRFNPVSQRLELIRVYNLSYVKLIYGDANFRFMSQLGAYVTSSREEAPTFLSVHSKFGPTSAGYYSDSKEAYMLHYPVVGLPFEIDCVGNNLCIFYSRRSASGT
jgi:hypothetical protein